uniref:Uncharacterized protein n=1 Tax=Arion vulgaris TaxID=1028688 RepID=A0A0B6ZSW7_9EUPU
MKNYNMARSDTGIRQHPRNGFINHALYIYNLENKDKESKQNSVMCQVCFNTGAQYDDQT